LSWSESDVFWGWQKNAGEMLGHEKSPLGRRGAPTKAEYESSRDYRDFMGVYCLYGNWDLLYVGEAGLVTNESLFDRIKSHGKDSLSGRWDRFSWFGREKCEGKCDVAKSLGQLEAVLIAGSNPGFNKQSGTLGEAVQAHQVPHESADGDVVTKIDRIQEAVTEFEDLMRRTKSR
jgi:hypothetical protein